MGQVTITIDLTAENAPILANLFSQFAGGITAEPVKTTDPNSAPTEARKTAESKNKPAADKKTTPNKESTVAESVKTEKSVPTKVEIRAVALKFSKASRQAELKEIFGNYGADKLSGIAEEDYPNLMKDLEAAYGKN